MKNVSKKTFKFEHTVPCLDWFETKKIEIKPEDYHYFRIERRYGPTWWIIGMNQNKNDCHWNDTELGKIENYKLKEFIEWAKTEHGSKIIEFKAISGSFDILEEIRKLMF